MEDRLEVLRLIEAGKISVAEGAQRLEGLAESTPSANPSPYPYPEMPTLRPIAVRWVWQIVLWIGIALAATSGYLLSSYYTREVAAHWLIWGWILFILGLLGILLGWWLHRARWLYVRVRQPDGPNISLALPLPLGLVGWILRIARPFAPQIEEMRIDELLLAMQEEIHEGSPFFVQVDEGPGRDQVQVYFG